MQNIFLILGEGKYFLEKSHKVIHKREKWPIRKKQISILLLFKKHYYEKIHHRENILTTSIYPGMCVEFT